MIRLKTCRVKIGCALAGKRTENREEQVDGLFQHLFVS